MSYLNITDASAEALVYHAEMQVDVQDKLINILRRAGVMKGMQERK